LGRRATRRSSGAGFLTYRCRKVTDIARDLGISSQPPGDPVGGAHGGGLHAQARSQRPLQRRVWAGQEPARRNRSRTVTETDRCWEDALSRAHPGSDAGLVALGVGQHPPRRRVVVCHQGARLRRSPPRSAPRPGRAAPRCRLDAVALRARRVHLLEPEQRSAATLVDQVLRAVAAVSVAEHGTPDGITSGMDERVDRDMDVLHDGWVGGDAQLAPPPRSAKPARCRARSARSSRA
jgi:hypothetical protein